MTRTTAPEMAPGSLAALVAAGAFAAVLSLATSACRSPSSSDRLEGRWIGVRAEGVGAESLAAANAFATSTELEFRRNEIFITAQHDARAGRYQVLKEDDETVTITTVRDGPTHPQTFTVDSDDDSLRWNVLEGKSIVFARE